MARMLRDTLDETAIASLLAAVEMALTSGTSYVQPRIASRVERWREGLLGGEQVSRVAEGGKAAGESFHAMQACDDCALMHGKARLLAMWDAPGHPLATACQVHGSWVTGDSRFSISTGCIRTTMYSSM